MRKQIITIGALFIAAFLSGCSSTRQSFRMYRGLEGGVETSGRAFAARYYSWRTSTSDSAEKAEVGVGMISPLEFPGSWSFKRRSSLGSDEVVVMVRDSEGSEQQRFVATPGSVYLLKTLESKPLTLAEDWQPQRMFDSQLPGPPGAMSFEVYTKNLLENSLQ